MIGSFFSELLSSLQSGGVILWVLLMWGGYLYYLLLDTIVLAQKNSSYCNGLDCMFAEHCSNRNAITLRYKGLRQDMMEGIEGRIRFLNLAINTAPLLGLLGTVTGMLKTFHVLSFATTSIDKSEMLSEGISEALITTQLGLIIAIPSFMLLRRVIRKSNEVEHTITCLETQSKRDWQLFSMMGNITPALRERAHT